MPEIICHLEFAGKQPQWIVCANTSVCKVTRGVVWLTRTGGAGDVFVRAGERATLPAGRWLAEAVGDVARAELHQSVAQPAAANATLWRRIATTVVS